MARFPWDRILKTETCWLWQGRLTPDGYGRFGQRLVHRIVYEELVGPIPDGLTLDHLADVCSSRACCFPDHMEPVTQGENARRGRNHWRERTHCDAGHEYTKANTRWHEVDGYRYRICRECQRLASLRWKRARGVQPATPRNTATHCANGHEFTEANTWVSPTTGYRKCRTCNRENQRRVKARRRTAA